MKFVITPSTFCLMFDTWSENIWRVSSGDFQIKTLPVSLPEYTQQSHQRVKHQAAFDPRLWIKTSISGPRPPVIWDRELSQEKAPGSEPAYGPRGSFVKKGETLAVRLKLSGVCVASW